MNIPSLEMCVVNVLTLLDSNIASYDNPRETNDDSVKKGDPYWNDSDFYDVLSQLVLLPSCDTKDVSLYKLQSSKISK